MEVSIDDLIKIIKASDYEEEEIIFIVKNIKHIEQCFIKKFKKDLVLTI